MAIPISKLDKFKVETEFGDGYVLHTTFDNLRFLLFYFLSGSSIPASRPPVSSPPRPLLCSLPCSIPLTSILSFRLSYLLFFCRLLVRLIFKCPSAHLACPVRHPGCHLLCRLSYGLSLIFFRLLGFGLTTLIRFALGTLAVTCFTM